MKWLKYVLVALVAYPLAYTEYLRNKIQEGSATHFTEFSRGLLNTESDKPLVVEVSGSNLAYFDILFHNDTTYELFINVIEPKAGYQEVEYQIRFFDSIAVLGNGYLGVKFRYGMSDATKAEFSVE